LRNKHSSFILQFIIFIFIFIIPFHSFSAEKSESIYTIQISSHRDVEVAQRQFKTIAQSLNESRLEHLRIEKIGEFYSLRLGKFNNNSNAKKFKVSVNSDLPSSIIMKAYFKEDRIIRIYRPQNSDNEVKTQQKSVPENITKKETGEKNPSTVVKTDQYTNKINNYPSSESKIALISSLVHKKDYNSALEIVEKEITEHPEHSGLNAWYGTVLLKKNNPEEALKYLEKAVALSPSMPDYHNNLGYCLFYLDKPDKAVNEFNKAVTLEPGHIDALSGLGIIYAKRGDKNKAMDIYKKLKNLDEDSANKLLKVVEKTQL